ncbi:MAG: hydrolase [Acidobacteria bacterium]|nr:MAG: hydrolase [Acidobacteriota bacterium]
MQSGMVIDAVRITDGPNLLDADLHLPEHARGLVVFAHGSGSSRFSSRNRQVADYLNKGHFATLLLDLLTQAEEGIDVRTAEFRFDIQLLGRRVVAATDWAAHHPVVGRLPIGYFGASTGAGGDDEPVIEMNETALRRMRAPVELAIVPGATHLFEEPGTLEEVERLALDWLNRHL